MVHSVQSTANPHNTKKIITSTDKTEKIIKNINKTLGCFLFDIKNNIFSYNGQTSNLAFLLTTTGLSITLIG